MTNYKDGKTHKIVVLCGEVSGDIHAANLIKQLAKKSLNLELYGIGGNNLAELGQKQLYHINDMSILGFSAAIKSIFKVKKMINTTVEYILEINPTLVILVDYPGFNLMVAKRLRQKNKNIKIVDYIIPKIWVWGYKRIGYLKKYIDYSMCILPFEEELLKRESVPSSYVGNPILDNISYKYKSENDFLNCFENPSNKPLLGLLPGSRNSELSKNILPCLEAYSKIKDKYKLVIALVCEDSRRFLPHDLDPDIQVRVDETYDVIRSSHIVWVCSGTASLEVAIHNKPMCIIYNVPKLVYFLAWSRILVQVTTIGLPNIIAKKNIVPELINKNFNPKMLIEKNGYIERNYAKLQEDLQEVSQLFLENKASSNAAKIIYKLFL